jgi:hypothetical protein
MVARHHQDQCACRHIEPDRRGLIDVRYAKIATTFRCEIAF